MARTLTLTIEELDRGNVLHVCVTNGNSGRIEEGEIIEGQRGSVNLRDRTRRRIMEIVQGYYPTSRTTDSGN